MEVTMSQQLNIAFRVWSGPGSTLGLVLKSRVDNYGAQYASHGTSEEFPPREIPPLTPYVWAGDPDCDLGVVSQALMLTNKARMNRMIKVLIEFIQDHLLCFVFSQDSTPLRSVPLFPYKKLNTFTSSST